MEQMLTGDAREMDRTLKALRSVLSHQWHTLGAVQVAWWHLRWCERRVKAAGVRARGIGERLAWEVRRSKPFLMMSVPELVERLDEVVGELSDGQWDMMRMRRDLTCLRNSQESLLGWERDLLASLDDAEGVE